MKKTEHNEVVCAVIANFILLKGIILNELIVTSVHWVYST